MKKNKHKQKRKETQGQGPGAFKHLDILGTREESIKETKKQQLEKLEEIHKSTLPWNPREETAARRRP